MEERVGLRKGAVNVNWTGQGSITFVPNVFYCLLWSLFRQHHRFYQIIFSRFPFCTCTADKSSLTILIIPMDGSKNPPPKICH